jgi:hypothetical protein
MWNEANPDRKIVLTYIPHAEMVAKLAQAIASGEVPDLMGMDLIYAPQFENAGQLVDITDKIKDWPELTTASPGHMTVATYEGRLYGVPLYADVSALFYNTELFEQAGLDPSKPPTSLAELREYADKITAIGGDIKGYFLPGSCAGCNIFTVGPLLWASGIKIEAIDPGDEPLLHSLSICRRLALPAPSQHWPCPVTTKRNCWPTKAHMQPIKWGESGRRRLKKTSQTTNSPLKMRGCLPAVCRLTLVACKWAKT